MIENLLTSKDVETKIFKKSSFGGYVVAEVDEFLDQVCEDLDIYLARIAELEHKNAQLEMKLKSYEEVKDSLQDTLFAAQRTARQIVAESQRSVAENESEAQNIIAEARVEAQRIIHESEDVLKQTQVERERVLHDAELDARDVKNLIIRLKHERNEFIDTSEALTKDYLALLQRNRETIDDR